MCKDIAAKVICLLEHCGIKILDLSAPITLNTFDKSSYILQIFNQIKHLNLRVHILVLGKPINQDLTQGCCETIIEVFTKSKDKRMR